MEFGLAVLLVMFCVAFASLTHGFTSRFNLFALSRSAAVNILVGLSMMSVIATGGLDLSIGATGVASAMVAGFLMQSLGLPIVAGIAGALVVGVTIGALNGLLVVRTGMHSFVVTLATMSIVFGAMILLTHASPYNALPDGFVAPARLHWFGSGSPLLAVALLAALLLGVLYRFTSLGRAMLACGANARAARLSGIDVGTTITICHAQAGLLAAVAALLLTMRNGAAIPAMAGNLGQDWLLPAFLGPVLGGALLAGGRVSVSGAVLGGLLVTVLNSGLLLMHVGEFWVQFFLGLLLLVAVLVDKLRHRIMLGLR